MNDITAQDRRDIAENLRSIAEFPGRHVRYVEQFKELLEDEIFPDVEYHDYSDMFEQLANLIDPTCEVALDEELSQELQGDMFRCNKCDAAFPRINGEYRYCPACGARVVRDEA